MSWQIKKVKSPHINAESLESVRRIAMSSGGLVKRAYSRIEIALAYLWKWRHFHSKASRRRIGKMRMMWCRLVWWDENIKMAYREFVWRHHSEKRLVAVLLIWPAPECRRTKANIYIYKLLRLGEWGATNWEIFAILMFNSWVKIALERQKDI